MTTVGDVVSVWQRWWTHDKVFNRFDQPIPSSMYEDEDEYCPFLVSRCNFVGVSYFTAPPPFPRVGFLRPSL